MKIKKQDLWDLDYVLATIILPYLKAFKKTKRTSYPLPCKSLKEWEEIIDKMIFSMEAIKNENKWYYYYLDKKKDKKNQVNKYLIHEQKVSEGLELFGKYFRGLWD